jgi:hypothetical protein
MNSAQKRRHNRGLRKLDHEIMIEDRRHVDAERWCRSNLGKRWEVIGHQEGLWACFWGGRGAHDKYRFCFAQEADAVLFALKWS